MTLAEYIEKLNRVVLVKPEAASYQVVYGEDDEGNSYTPVHYSPSLGYYEDREFNTNPDENDEFNAVCIN